jgi:MarR family transcriptional regulator for hemolysin
MSIDSKSSSSGSLVSVPAPTTTPIGLQLAATAKTISRAFDSALSAAGGSIPIWLILLSIKSRTHGNQRDLAETIGITTATLTHHLNAMEASGLLTRRRDPDNRRIHRVELTNAGEAAFRRLRQAAVAFDQRLRTGVDDTDLADLARLLEQLHANVTTDATSTKRATPV